MVRLLELCAVVVAVESAHCPSRVGPVLPTLCDRTFVDYREKPIRSPSRSAPVPSERMDSLAAVLAAIRGGSGITQPQLTQQVGLGRSVVAARIAELESAGLVASAGMAPSTGGRAPRQLRLRAEAGVVVGADIGATHMNVGIADLAGHVIGAVNESVDIADGPDVVLSRVEQIVDELRAAHPEAGEVWG